MNKKKFLVLKPSSRVGFERPFKTASSVLKRIQNWTVSSMFNEIRRINRVLFQNVSKKKILVLKPSSRVGFERPFKTASSMLKKFKFGQCL